MIGSFFQLATLLQHIFMQSKYREWAESLNIFYPFVREKMYLKRFLAREDRRQVSLAPQSPKDALAEDIPVHVLDVFVDKHDLAALDFGAVIPEVTGSPAYDPTPQMNVYSFGYLNHVRSSRWSNRSGMGRER